MILEPCGLATMRTRPFVAASLLIRWIALRSADFARLMPAEALAYIEINEPGQQVHRLLDMLGLIAEPGATTDGQGPRVAVSPRLIKAVLGIRGAAVAVTGFDPAAEMPQGVAVLHPGSVDASLGNARLGMQLVNYTTRQSQSHASSAVSDDEGWWIKAAVNDDYYLTRGSGRRVEYKRIPKSDLATTTFS